MIGLPGPQLRPEDVALFRDTRAAALILYRRNFEHPTQLLTLIDRLESALERRLLVATDHEGGRVIMLGQGVTIFPDNLAAGTAGEESWIHRQGFIEARELRRLGVDLNLAPVLDVLTERYSPNIGTRAYGTDPARVARCGVARIRGMARGGLLACAKHFPGKGHSPLDAHLGLPRIESTWDEMRARHLPPFRAAIEAGVPCLMTSHPVYPRLDAAGIPTTFSRRIVTDFLRGELGFTGAVLSDDLEMGAVTETCAVGEAAVRAARAGHDLLLVCHTESAQRQAAQALVEAYRSGALPRGELETAVERVRRLRLSHATRCEGGPPNPEEEGPPLARAMATRAVTEVNRGPADFLRRLNRRVVVIFPRLSELAPRITLEPEFLDEAAYLGRAFALVGIAPEVVLVAVEPTPSEIETATERARAADAVALFLFDAHLYASNRALLEALQAAAPALAVVLLRDPYDAALLRPGVLGLTAWGFRRCQLDAVIARLAYPRLPSR